jgi:regulator of replication initiation timing
MENRGIEKKQLNAEENYMTTPISVLSYIRALEEQNKHLLEEIERLKSKVSNWMDKYTEVNEENKKLQRELKDK